MSRSIHIEIKHIGESDHSAGRYYLWRLRVTSHPDPGRKFSTLGIRGGARKSMKTTGIELV